MKDAGCFTEKVHPCKLTVSLIAEYNILHLTLLLELMFDIII